MQLKQFLALLSCGKEFLTFSNLSISGCAFFIFALLMSLGFSIKIFILEMSSHIIPPGTTKLNSVSSGMINEGDIIIMDNTCHR